MNILHTESSAGWGGQEIRILREAEGMRLRGHQIFFAIAKGGKLIEKARKKGFIVSEIDFKKKKGVSVLFQLAQIIKKHDIQIVNTHSSLDAWFGGIAARLLKKKIVRTRHLSTPIKKGINSRLLYKSLADYVVTTSSSIISMICSQSGLSEQKCSCIATGVDPKQFAINRDFVDNFRERFGLRESDVLVGTACFVRSWKGIKDFIHAANILKDEKNLKWVIVGGGYVDEYKPLAAKLGLSDILFFTGHLEDPIHAIAAFDIFALLSTAHEGISQASLQAGFLKKPLITTTIGGLPEVCLDAVSGLNVPPCSPDAVAKAVLQLKNDSNLRQAFGNNAKKLVEEKFTFKRTLDEMEKVYSKVFTP